MQQPTVSLSTLTRAFFAALFIAAVVLVTFILPAEYNVDPTGLGKKLGLTLLAETADSAPIAEVAGAAQSIAKEAPSTTQEQLIEVTVPARKGIEYKFYMTQYEKLTYEWAADGDPLYFDLHGEPEGDTTGYFESYAIATLTEMKGSFTAPFSGSHGWYWKNTSDKPINVQLIVKGQYEIIGLKP